MARYIFASDTNHNGSSDTKTYIIAKAKSATAVTVAGGVSFTYDGLSHPATVAVTGIGGLNDSPAPVYSCGHAPINFADSGCTASYSFAGDTNHNGSSDTKTYIIAKAESATAVRAGCAVSYADGSHTQPATVTGPGSLNPSAPTTHS